MNSKTMLSLAILAISSVAMATGTEQSVESTKKVFTTSEGSVDVAHSTKVDVTTTPSPFTISSGVSNVRITGTITPTFNAETPVIGDLVTVSDKYPQAALAAYNNVWYGWHCTAANGSAGEWSEITGSTASEDASSDVEVEFSSESIKYTVPGVSTATVTATLTNPCNFKNITKLAFSGYGSYGAFTGLNVEKLTITVDTAAANVAKVIADAGGLNSKGGNGLTAWETLVLGLEDTDTVVYTAPVQASDENLLGFKLGNAFTETYGVTGASVTYKVQKCTTPNGTYEDAALKNANGTSHSGDAAGNETVYIDVPTSGVEYYKIKITIQ